MSPAMMAAVGVMIVAMSSILAFVVVARTGPRAKLKLRIADIAGGVKDVSAARGKVGVIFPRGDLIVYGGTQVFTSMPLLGVHPDGTPAKLPEINVQRDGERTLTAGNVRPL